MKDTNRSFYIGSHIASEIAPTHVAGNPCPHVTGNLGNVGARREHPTALKLLRPHNDRLNHFGGGEKADNIMEWLMR